MDGYADATSPSGTLLEAVYAAGMGEADWDVALDAVAIEVGGDIAAVFADRPTYPGPFTCFTNANADVEKVFASWTETARHLDPLRAALDKLPPGHVIRVSDLMNDSEFRNSAFFADYAARFGGTDCLDADLARQPSSLLNLCVYGQDGKTLLPDASQRLERLIPHVRRSLRLDQLIARASTQQLFALAALDDLSIPVLAIDGRRMVIFANKSARELLARDDGLTLRQGVLDTSERQYPPFATTLRRLAEQPGKFPNVQTVPIARADRGPLAVTALVPARHHEFWTVTGVAGGAILFIGDSEQEVAAVGSSLQLIHGLTHREAQVAIDLSNGLQLGTIARRAGVGVDTVRKQLKQAFAKTGTSRQAELVRLVLLELGYSRRQSAETVD